MFYLEGSFSFWSEFSGFVAEIKVLVIKPYLISNFPGGETGVYAVFHKKGGFFMGGDGFLPSFGKKVEVFF